MFLKKNTLYEVDMANGLFGSDLGLVKLGSGYIHLDQFCFEFKFSLGSGMVRVEFGSSQLRVT